MARAGVWYTDNISVTDSIVEAPKNFRRCNNLKLKNVTFPNAQETLWSCDHVDIENVSAKGDYFGMNTNNLIMKNFQLVGNYSFDGSRNVEVHDSKLISRMPSGIRKMSQSMIHLLQVNTLAGTQKSDTYKLHNRELAGALLHRQPRYEKL